ncbi:MAG: hypothetical protein HQL80_03825 [Magnetococcales bacterium]|nr:hypothetical protein [Magnetococcales bacterium]
MRDPDARKGALYSIIAKLGALSQEQAREMFTHALPVLQHNAQTLRNNLFPVEWILQEIMRELSGRP